jgi:hypothetical protein
MQVYEYTHILSKIGVLTYERMHEDRWQSHLANNAQKGITAKNTFERYRVY